MSQPHNTNLFDMIGNSNNNTTSDDVQIDATSARKKTRKPITLPDKHCQWPGCDKMFTPGSGKAKYCPGPHKTKCQNPYCGKYFETTAAYPTGAHKYCSECIKEVAKRNLPKPKSQTKTGICAYPGCDKPCSSKRAKTCSKEHAQMLGARTQTTRPKTCAYPGCEKPISSKNAKTCCKAHAVALRKLTQKKQTSDLNANPDKVKICAHPGCGEKFIPVRKNQKYCTAQHQNICLNCGDPFDVGPGSTTKYCSPHCAAVAGHTPESQRKRRENSLKKWGTENPFQSEEVKAKTRRTLEEHPELDNRIGSANFEKTLKEKYGEDVSNASQVEEVKEKKKATTLDHYGVENPMQSKEIQDKVAETSMKKYGVPCALNLKENREKAKEGTRKKFGADYVFQSEEGRRKAREGNQRLYGVDYALQSEEGKKKAIQTNLDKYGTEWSSQNEDVKAKKLKTVQERYGVDNVFQLQGVKQKTKKTMTERYGEDNPMKVPEIRKRAAESISKTIMRKANDGITYDRSPVSKKNKEFSEIVLEADQSIKVEYEHVIPGTSQRVDFKFYTEDREIYVDLNPTISHNSEKSYWCIVTKCRPNPKTGAPHVHNDPPAKNYSALRARIMESTYPMDNYVQIWDWDDKAFMIENIVESLLKPERSYSAHDLIIEEIPQSEANKLLKEWHPQGAGRKQTACYSLVDPKTGEPLMTGTFGKPRFSKDHQWEWIRSAIKPGVRIYGGQSKVFKRFRDDHDPESVVSYIDFSKTTTAMTFLNHCGFSEVKPTGPALVWSKGDESVPETSLLRLGADRLLGTSYGSREESGLDNHGIMLAEGWLPVWTAGNRVFTWTAGSDANNRTLPAM